MYCQTCGNQVSDELSFCNRCGNRVAGRNELMQTSANVSVLKSLSIATGFVGVVGSGGLLALIIILVANHVEAPAAAMFALLFALTVFGVCFMLTRQIGRLTQTALPEKKNARQNSAPEQLNAPTTRQIEMPIASFRSVTENTTRTLDNTKV